MYTEYIPIPDRRMAMARLDRDCGWTDGRLAGWLAGAIT